MERLRGVKKGNLIVLVLSDTFARLVEPICHDDAHREEVVRGSEAPRGEISLLRERVRLVLWENQEENGEDCEREGKLREVMIPCNEQVRTPPREVGREALNLSAVIGNGWTLNGVILIVDVGCRLGGFGASCCVLMILPAFTTLIEGTYRHCPWLSFVKTVSLI